MQLELRQPAKVVTGLPVRPLLYAHSSLRLCSQSPERSPLLCSFTDEHTLIQTKQTSRSVSHATPYKGTENCASIDIPSKEVSRASFTILNLSVIF